jgi:hypothetical protein
MTQGNLEMGSDIVLNGIWSPVSRPSGLAICSLFPMKEQDPVRLQLNTYNPRRRSVQQDTLAQF